MRERYLTNELESKDKVLSVVEKNVDTYQRYVLGKYEKKYVLCDQELRERYLTNELESKDKVSFYQSVVEKNVDAYQIYVLGKYGKKI